MGIPFKILGQGVSRYVLLFGLHCFIGWLNCCGGVWWQIRIEHCVLTASVWLCFCLCHCLCLCLCHDTHPIFKSFRVKLSWHMSNCRVMSQIHVSRHVLIVWTECQGCVTLTVKTCHEIRRGCQQVDVKTRLRKTFSVQTLKNRLPILKWIPNYRSAHQHTLPLWMYRKSVDPRIKSEKDTFFY